MVSFSIALLGAVIAVKWLRRRAAPWGLVDRPGGRKQHQRPTPVIGGLAIGLAALAALPFALAASIPATVEWPALVGVGVPLLLSAALVLTAGVIDDRRGLASGPKFAIQGLAALLVVAGAGAVLHTLGRLPDGPTVSLGAWAWPISVVAVVGFVNAFNMIDGVDGLAGSTAVVMLGLLGGVAVLAGAAGLALCAATVIGAVLGFLAFNLRSPLRRRASVFLGDAGSMLLGLIIAWLAIDLSQRAASPVSPVAIAWILVLPVTDTLSLMTRRLFRGQNPFHADRNHLHHLLGRAGFSPGQSAMIFAALTLALGAVGLLGGLAGVPDVLLAGGLLGVAVAHYFFVRYAWRSTRAIRRLRQWMIKEDSRRIPIADRFALLGLYALAIGIPLGSMAVVGAALVGLGLASLAQRAALLGELRALALTRIALALGVWLGLAVFLRPDPVGSAWWPMLWLTGLVALPLGWWLARFRHHTAPLFGLALLVLTGLWASTVDWHMIEAGYFQTPAYWGGVHTGGLLLAVMLTVLVGVMSAGMADYRRRWRARATFAGALAGMVLLVMLILGLQLKTAVAAGLIGFIAMLAAAALYRPGRRLTASLVLAVAVTVLGGSALANGFKPPGVSLNADYLGPLRAALLYAGGAPDMAESLYAGVTTRLDDALAVFRLAAERPLAGYGHPAVGVPGDTGAVPELRSGYAVLLLTAGWPGLLLFVALLIGWMGAIAGALRSRVWPASQAIAAQGMLWSALGLMLFVPLVTDPVSGMILNVVLALGVAAGVERRRAPPDAADVDRAAPEVAQQRPALRLIRDQSLR